MDSIINRSSSNFHNANKKTKQQQHHQQQHKKSTSSNSTSSNSSNSNRTTTSGGFPSPCCHTREELEDVDEHERYRAHLRNTEEKYRVVMHVAWTNKGTPNMAAKRHTKYIYIYMRARKKREGTRVVRVGERVARSSGNTVVVAVLTLESFGLELRIFFRF